MNTTSRMSAPRPPMIQRRRAPAVLMMCAVLAVIFIPCLLTSGYYAFTLRYSTSGPQSRIPRAGQAFIPVCSARARQPGPDGPAVTKWLARVALASGDRDDLGAEQAPATDVQEADSSLW